MRVELVLLGLSVLALSWLRRHPRSPGESERDERRGTWRPNEQDGASRSDDGTTASARQADADSVRFNAGADAAGVDAATRDALTGAFLRRGAMLFRCMQCKSYYHDESIKLLNQENRGRCVSCGGTNIVRDQIAEDSLDDTSHSSH